MLTQAVNKSIDIMQTVLKASILQEFKASLHSLPFKSPPCQVNQRVFVQGDIVPEPLRLFS